MAVVPEHNRPDGYSKPVPETESIKIVLFFTDGSYCRLGGTSTMKVELKPNIWVADSRTYRGQRELIKYYVRETGKSLKEVQIYDKTGLIKLRHYRTIPNIKRISLVPEL